MMTYCILLKNIEHCIVFDFSVRMTERESPHINNDLLYFVSSVRKKEAALERVRDVEEEEEEAEEEEEEEEEKSPGDSPPGVGAIAKLAFASSKGKFFGRSKVVGFKNQRS